MKSPYIRHGHDLRPSAQSAPQEELGSSVRLALGLTVLEPHHVGTHFGTEGARVWPVHLDQVSAWIPNVELHLTARQFGEVRAHGFGVVKSSPTGGVENR